MHKCTWFVVLIDAIFDPLPTVSVVLADVTATGNMIGFWTKVAWGNLREIGQLNKNKMLSVICLHNCLRVAITVLIIAVFYHQLLSMCNIIWRLQ